jgi:hypothetical protein
MKPTTLLLLLLLTTACTDADPGRGTAKACDPCTWDGDCADGLFCDSENAAMVCRTPKMAEAKAFEPNTPQCDRDCWRGCAVGGTCNALTSSNGRKYCGPDSEADCQQSDTCKISGACAFCTIAGQNSCRDKCN